MITEAKAESATTAVKTFGTSRPDPGMYMLSHLVRALPLKMGGSECIFGQAWDRLSRSEIKEVERHALANGDTYVTAPGKVQITGEWTTRNLLHNLLELHGKGVDPFAARWFPYDWSHYEDVVVHGFFVLYDNKIVEEQFSFSNHSPLVLERPALYKDPEVHNRLSVDEAVERYWYREFYAATMVGQMMVLRPDDPPLYYFDRPTRDSMPDFTLAMLTKLYYLLWVIIPILGAIVFPSLRTVMTIAAIILLGVWAIASWQLRKVGTNQ